MGVGPYYLGTGLLKLRNLATFTKLVDFINFVRSGVLNTLFLYVYCSVLYFFILCLYVFILVDAFPRCFILS